MKHESLILFTCAACGYRARIPRSYDGTAIVCPSCQHQQVAEAKDDQPRTGNTQILTQPKSAAPASALPAAAVAVPDLPTAQAKSVESAPQAVKPPGLTLTPLGTPALKVPAASSASAADGKISFHCGKCGAKTRIPSEYAGRVVRCPSCESIQIAMPGASPTTGRIVKGVAANAPKTAKLDDTGKIIFVCTNCQFQGRLAQTYAGKAIQCPSCRQPQVVDLMPSGTSAAESPGGTDVMTMTAVVRRSDADAVKPAVLNAPPPLKKVTELNPPMTASPIAAPGQTPGGRTPTPATLLPESRPSGKPASPAQGQTTAKSSAPATGTTGSVAKSFPTPAPTTGKIVRRGNTSASNAEGTSPKPTEPPNPATGPAPAVMAGNQVEELKSSARGMLLGLSGAVVVLLIISVILWTQMSGARHELDLARQELETQKDALKAAKAEWDAAKAQAKVLSEEKTKAVAERDAARTERDTAQAEREAARTEREAAAAARDEARKERDDARGERDQLRKAAASQ